MRGWIFKQGVAISKSVKRADLPFSFPWVSEMMTTKISDPLLAFLRSCKMLLQKINLYFKTYLSLDILQSMTVFLLVFTMMNGSCMAELAAGGP